MDEEYVNKIKQLNICATQLQSLRERLDNEIISLQVQTDILKLQLKKEQNKIKDEEKIVYQKIQQYNYIKYLYNNGNEYIIFLNDENDILNDAEFWKQEKSKLEKDFIIYDCILELEYATPTYVTFKPCFNECPRLLNIYHNDKSIDNVDINNLPFEYILHSYQVIDSYITTEKNNTNNLYDVLRLKLNCLSFIKK